MKCCRSLLVAFFCICLQGAYAKGLKTPPPLVGCYYFDGWADRSANNFHLDSMPQNYPQREPLSGWYDDTLPLVHQQVAWARQAGIDFFIFDWYYLAHDTNAHERKSLNSAVKLFRSDPNKLGMRYALLYVNNGIFSIPPSEWDAQCARWIKEDFSDANYVKIEGKPLLVVFSVGDMEKTWGGVEGVAKAWQRLRELARQANLPGVYLVACATPGPQHGWNDLNRLVQEGYDAFSGYNYLGVPGTHEGENPYALLIDGSLQIWDDFANDGRKPYIPVSTDGWDPRPWHETNFWYTRTPQEFELFVRMAREWWLAHPNMHVLPDRPLLFVEAWNELGEGSYIVPTKGDRFAYLDALKRALK